MDKIERKSLTAFLLAKRIWHIFNRSLTGHSVIKYIANQHDHHQQQTFKQEYRSMLTEYQTMYDERYVWD